MSAAAVALAPDMAADLLRDLQAVPEPAREFLASYRAAGCSIRLTAEALTISEFDSELGLWLDTDRDPFDEAATLPEKMRAYSNAVAFEAQRISEVEEDPAGYAAGYLAGRRERLMAARRRAVQDLTLIACCGEGKAS